MAGSRLAEEDCQLGLRIRASRPFHPAFYYAAAIPGKPQSRQSLVRFNPSDVLNQTATDYTKMRSNALA